MKTRLWILICCLISTPLPAQTTNLVEILRQYQAELDAKAAGLSTPPPAAPTPPINSADPKPISPAPAPTTNVTIQKSPAPTPSLPRLQPGDTLKLEVIGEPDMSADSLTITPEGSIRLPIAGPLKVANLTLPEAVNSIRSLLARDYLVDPNVRLWRTATVEPSPQLPTENTKDIWPGAPSAPSITPPPDTAARPDTCHFTISDQVAKPGRYEWPGNQNMTILRAIGMAGGTKASANLGKVVIRRNSNGKTKDTPCDLRKIAWVPENEIPLLQNGDEIIVPRE